MKKFYLVSIFMAFALMSMASTQTITATLTVSTPTFVRPNIGTPPTALSAYTVPYTTFTFTAPVSGLYTFEANTPAIDNFGVLYQNSFNPASPLTNAKKSDDGSSGNPGDNFQFSYSLVAGVTYTLVICTFYYGEFGSFPVMISGPFSTTLPVQVANFDAKLAGSDVQVSWNTLSERNSSHFNVLRSSDGINFSSIGTIESKADNGNSDKQHEYNFVDRTPLSVNFYQLQQIDIDGKATLHNIVRVDNSAMFSDISVYPNPSQSVTHVRFYSPKTAKIEARITSLYGATLQVKTISSNQGINEINFDVNALPQGFYGVELINNGVRVHSQLFSKN